MPAIDLLRSQHREAEDLLQRIREGNGAPRVRLIGELAEALTLHAALEEQYFYPLLRAEGMGELVDRSLAEHAEVKRLISDILEMKQRDPRLGELVARLEKAVRAHVEEEENEVFPRVRDRVDAQVLHSTEEQMRRGMGDLQDKELLELADEQGGVSPA